TDRHPLPLVALKRIGKVGGISMPPSNVLLTRLSKLSLLCALFGMVLSPGALGVYAYSSSATGVQAQAANPSISLTPGLGSEGYRIAVRGRGFAPNSTITVRVDGSPVSTSCKADASGSFSSCVFTPPPETTGTHTVTAADDNSNSASAGFVLNPGISLTPSRGPVGSGAAVSGSGFTPNSRITVTVSNHHVSTNCRANAV